MRVKFPNTGGSVFHINKSNKYPPEEGERADSLHTADVALRGGGGGCSHLLKPHSLELILLSKLDFKFSDLVKFCNKELLRT